MSTLMFDSGKPPATAREIVAINVSRGEPPFTSEVFKGYYLAECEASGEEAIYGDFAVGIDVPLPEKVDLENDADILAAFDLFDSEISDDELEEAFGRTQRWIASWNG